MIFADTGFFVAVAIASDQLHERAVSWARAVEPATIITTDYVLVEAVNLMSGLSLRRLAAVLVQDLRGDDCEIVHVDRALLDAGLDMHAAMVDKEWSLTDCISFIVMRQRGIRQALAHDHHFAQAGFDPLLRRNP